MSLSDLKSTPIIIICRDRLKPLRALLEWLDNAGYARPILLDNGSTYPPLVDFLDRSPEIETVRLGRNLGHLAPWASDEMRAKLRPNEPFVATDCDIVPDDGCPADVVEHLAEALLGFADIDKVGLGLRIDNLPDSYALKDEVLAWESRFWEREIAPGIFDAEVDTTFALYRSIAVPHGTVRALRTGAPYVARHLSWYADSAHPTDEQRYYREHAEAHTSHWETETASDNLRGLLRRRADEVTTRELVETLDNPLLAAWATEPSLRDEVAFTPWADRGWSAWNDMSPELEFCEFAGALMRLIEPELVIETGVGQGFVTRRLAAQLRADQELLAFEDDAGIREQLKRLPFFQTSNCSVGASPSPSDEDLSRAGLTVLDSEAPTRFEEIDRWIGAAHPGAVLFVHDTGNGHGPDTVHHLIRQHVIQQGIRGVFLHNPRGSFLGLKT